MENIKSRYKYFKCIDEFKKELALVENERYEFDKYLSIKYKDKEFSLNGFCTYCNKPSSFKVDWLHKNNDIPNFRERMICEHCRLNNRIRFISTFTRELINDLAKDQTKSLDIYCHENITTFFKLIEKEHSKKHNVSGSEYLGHDKSNGYYYSGIRHEDIQKSSFNNESFDLIISQDVLEHVPSLEKSLKEVYRTLKVGGLFLFSIPFDLNIKKTQSRAILLEDNTIEYIDPPVYHGNPVDTKGSLVFHDFGTDLFDIIKSIGFKELVIVSYYNFFYGHIGGTTQFCFLAKK